MIPGWKLRRELLRIKQRFGVLPYKIFGKKKSRTYDNARRTNLKYTNGQFHLTEKIAIFLIYQPKGISASTIETCRDLVKDGYSPFIVCNTPLSDHDRASLILHAWKIVERPNFGYDFGGYRDAIFHLWDEKIKPEKLMIFNDSIWFVPTTKGTFLDIFSETDGKVMGGAVRTKGQRNWIESYFFKMTFSSFSNQKFIEFWRRYILTDNKFIVIRTGERDFGVALESGGITLEGIVTKRNFLETLALEKPEFLYKTLIYATTAPKPFLVNERQALIQSFSDADSWKASAMNHIRVTLEFSVPHVQFIFPCVKLLNFPFIKKSNDPLTMSTRSQYLRAVAHGDLPCPTPSVLKEIQERQTQPVRKNPPWMNA